MVGGGEPPPFCILTYGFSIVVSWVHVCNPMVLRRGTMGFHTWDQLMQPA